MTKPLFKRIAPIVVVVAAASIVLFQNFDLSGYRFYDSTWEAQIPAQPIKVIEPVTKDAHPAIQSAIDALAATGGTVQLKAGTYYLSKELRLRGTGNDANFIRFVGESKHETTLQLMDGVRGNVISLAHNVGPDGLLRKGRGFKIAHMKIRGNLVGSDGSTFPFPAMPLAKVDPSDENAARRMFVRIMDKASGLVAIRTQTQILYSKMHEEDARFDVRGPYVSRGDRFRFIGQYDNTLPLLATNPKGPVCDVLNSDKVYAVDLPFDESVVSIFRLIRVGGCLPKNVQDGKEYEISWLMDNNNASFNGIYVEADDVSIRNVIVENTSWHGIMIGSGPQKPFEPDFGTTVSNVLVEASSVSDGLGSGIASAGSANVEIVNSEVFGFHNGIHVERDKLEEFKGANVWVQGNLVADNRRAGISGWKAATRVFFVANRLKGNTYCMIFSRETENVTISGNLCDGVGTTTTSITGISGIEFQGVRNTGSGILVKGNTIRNIDLGRNRILTGHGIVIDAMGGVILDSNQFINLANSDVYTPN